MEIANEDLQTKVLDHHGLVAAMCKELKIAERIDARLGNGAPRRVVSPGQSVVAMIINGLGFTNRRLYLTDQFFESKPINRLLDAPEIEAKDITDYTLAHTLDEISAYGPSKLYGGVAFEVAIENDLLSTVNHLDTTSFSTEGEYDVEEKENVIKVTHGFSKDHRPDLKQVVLSLVTNGPGAMPVWMDALDGNSSDKKSFHETIKRVETFKQQMNTDKNFKWVADSALYTKAGLLKDNTYLWLTRVPETISEARALVEVDDSQIDWIDADKGYKTAAFFRNYGDIEQRWLLVFSEQAYAREKKTFDKKLEKLQEALKKKLWHLGSEKFNCADDANKAMTAIIISKDAKFFDVTVTVKPILKYEKKGRPGPEDKQIATGYVVETSIERNVERINTYLNRKGRFVLATNDLDEKEYGNEKMLNEYKEQQDVEQGFKFLKDPWFMVDSIFLKTPSRIQGLMVVMTLCLMVYNLMQYKLRQKLKETDDTLPNQLGKEVKNPTVRWIFQIMEGIGLVRFFQDDLSTPIKECICNLNILRKKIIRLFGDIACWMYGLNEKNHSEILEM